MPTVMTPRERKVTALAHEEPDRVPMALWGSYYTLNDGTYFNILKHLKLGEPLPPFRRYMSRNSNYYDDIVYCYTKCSKCLQTFWFDMYRKISRRSEKKD